MTLIAARSVRRSVWGLALAAAVALAGCAHAPAIGRGGTVYAVSVESIDGHGSAATGPPYLRVFSIQVGDRYVPVWMADEAAGERASERSDGGRPTLLEGDAAALKAGILIERTWTDAVVHQVTEDELRAGAAIVYVPGPHRPMVVELRFEPVSAPAANGSS